MAATPGAITTDANGNHYKVVLADDFGGGYKSSNWGSAYNGGLYGNGAFRWSAGDVKVASGEMQVSETRHSNGSWTAGGFNSKAAGITIKYGTVEFDARVETAQGTQAAILLWPKSDVWPRDGEIDILETPKGSAMHTLHWAGDKNQDVYSGKLSGIDTSQTHHYKMTWLPNLIKVEVDGKVTATWTNPDLIPDSPMGFGAMGYVANNSQAWLGGGPNSSTPSKVTTHIDNMVMSQWTGTAPVSGGSMGGSANGGTTGNNIAPVSSTPVVTTLGSGGDTLILKISQDAYKGSAQYTISVDGKQIGGTLTAGASHAAGQDDTITVKGNWGAGSHKVTVKFLNDSYGGNAAADRNLHVDGITFNGAALNKGSTDLGANGPVDFGFSKVASPGQVVLKTVGTGSDTLVLKVSQDAYKGDAQYTISVDGKQIGGVLTASASHAAGHDDIITVKGDWAAGTHKLAVNFLNDSYGGSAGADRNLHVDGIIYDGATVAKGVADLHSNGPISFSFVDQHDAAHASSDMLFA